MLSAPDSPARSDVGEELWLDLWARVEQAETEIDRLRVLVRLLEHENAALKARARIRSVS